MTVYFVSRHRGAIEWAAEEGLRVDLQIDHFDPAQIQPQDTVIGTLPVNLAAEVCARGARYIHLTLQTPASLRGVELTVEQMRRCNARLTRYEVTLKPSECS